MALEGEERQKLLSQRYLEPVTLQKLQSNKINASNQLIQQDADEKLKIYLKVISNEKILIAKQKNRS